MSNNGCDAQTASFIEALRTCSASRVLELGTLDESFARAVIEGVNWVGSLRYIARTQEARNLIRFWCHLHRKATCNLA